MSEYSIADFLNALASDNLEKKMIKLMSEGYADEALLTKLIETMRTEIK